jgi:hypothetical protein
MAACVASIRHCLLRLVTMFLLIPRCQQQFNLDASPITLKVLDAADNRAGLFGTAAGGIV